ncbi:MAG: phosphotransferase [Candidatus Micrarchaeia archaeon]
MQKSLEGFIRGLDPRLFGRESAGRVHIYKGVLAGEMRINRIAAIGSKRYLVRFGKNASKAKNLRSLRKEYLALKAVDGMGIAPRAYYLERGRKFDKPFMLLDYIEGKPLHGLTKDRLIEIAGIVGRLHAHVPTASERKQIDSHELAWFVPIVLGGRVQSAISFSGKYISAGSARTISEAYEKIKSMDFSNTQLRLIHGDLSLQNMLYGKSGIKLIDFNTFCISEPELDLAQFFYRTALDGNERQIFLREYGKYSKPDIRLLHDAEQVRSLDRALWGFLEAIKMHDDPKRIAVNETKSASIERYLSYSRYAYARCRTLGIVPRNSRWSIFVPSYS